jgi:two-component system chemotaxis response regulator CheY
MRGSFIIVDDDRINNKICSILLSMTVTDRPVICFQEPEEGLDYIQREFSAGAPPSILLLDINMPSMTGWEFMTRFQTLNEAVKEKITVYILSSSVDQHDIDKAAANPLIKGFISKPLSQETARELAGVLNTIDES